MKPVSRRIYRNPSPQTTRLRAGSVSVALSTSIKLAPVDVRQENNIPRGQKTKIADSSFINTRDRRAAVLRGLAPLKITVKSETRSLQTHGSVSDGCTDQS